MRYLEWEVSLLSDSRPKEAVVEVTTACNYSCIHCFRNAMFNEASGRMELGFFRRLVGELAEVYVEKIVFSGWGEPLTHPDVVDMIREAKDYGLYVILNTNGSLLSVYADSLCRVGVDEIVVSVDSVESDIYGAIRVGGVLSEVVKGVLRVNKLRGYEAPPRLSMLYTINSLNLDSVIKVPSFAKRLGIEKVILSHIIPLSVDHERSAAVYASSELVKKLSGILNELSKEVLAVGCTVSLPSSRLVVSRSCPFITNRALFIRWDGYVTPCTNYAHNWVCTFMGVRRVISAVKFGNLRDEGLVDSWCKPEYVAFRARASFFTQPSCLDCELAPYCTYTTSNLHDCYGNSPTCAHCPYSHNIVRCPL